MLAFVSILRFIEDFTSSSRALKLALIEGSWRIWWRTFT